MCLCTIFRTELLRVVKNHVESILKCKTEQRSSLDLGYLVTDSITTNYKRFCHIISKTIPIEKRRNHFEVNSRRCTTTSAAAAAMTTSLPIHASLFIFYAVPNYNSLLLSVAVCCIFQQCLIKQTNAYLRWFQVTTIQTHWNRCFFPPFAHLWFQKRNK